MFNNEWGLIVVPGNVYYLTLDNKGENMHLKITEEEAEIIMEKFDIKAMEIPF